MSPTPYLHQKITLHKPIGDCVYRNFDFLARIARTRSERKRQQLLSSADSDQILSLVEICSNILRGTFPVNKIRHKKLLPFATTLRQLSRARSEKRARGVLRQTGAGVGLLLASLLSPVLAEAARHFLSNGK